MNGEKRSPGQRRSFNYPRSCQLRVFNLNGVLIPVVAPRVADRVTNEALRKRCLLGKKALLGTEK
jgi:hypothetical protein